MNTGKVKAAIQTLEALKFKIDFECAHKFTEINENNWSARDQLENKRMERLSKINDVIEELKLCL